MFACHLFMMGGHSHGDNAHVHESNESKKGDKSCH
jgi:hypothetical protein